MSALVLVYVGLFGWSMLLLAGMFPPIRVIAGEEVAVMPIAHAFGAVSVAGLVGSSICWAYFHQRDQMWKRMAGGDESRQVDD